MAATTIEGLGPIPSFTGDLPSFVRMLDSAPDPRDGWFQVLPSSRILRSWVREAAAWNDVPHAFLAAMLQQENSPRATSFQRAGQLFERQLQSGGAAADEGWLPVPDKVSGGSTGIANMKRSTLRATDDYIARTYNRPAVPEKVKAGPRRLHPGLYTKDDGIKIPFTDTHLGGKDLRLPGQDIRVDIYYMAAHLRQLIDRTRGKGKPYAGPLTLDDIAAAAAAYNGSGAAAAKYGQDCAGRLTRAAAGTDPLVFYAEAGAE